MKRLSLFLLAAISTFALALTLAAPPLSAAGSAAGVAYPKDHQTWTKVTKLALVGEKDRIFKMFGGVHDVYVNAAGLEALKAGKPYPDGSVLVLDLFEAGGTAAKPEPGARKGLFVMQKDSKTFAATGGWGFEQFKGDTKDTRGVTDAKKQCYGCHATKKKTDFTYTKYTP